MKCLTYTNSGHIDLCENMLRSFRRVNDHTDFKVYCMDNESYDYFTRNNYTAERATHKSCPSDALDWGTTHYRELIQNKFPMILDELDDQILFVDSDIFFFKDPVPYLTSCLQNINVVSQSDFPAAPLCSGFFAVNPADQIRKLLELIIDYDPLTDEPFDDQIRFNRFIVRTKTPVYILNRHYFPNGHTAFIEKSSRADKFIVHANFVVGHAAKISALQSIGAWIYDQHQPLEG